MAEKILTEEELIEKYLYKLKLLNETIWEKKATQKKINAWLNNFNSHEKVHALYLLTQFIYFSEFQVKTLFESLYRDLYKYAQIEQIRRQNNDTLDEDFINSSFQKVLRNTRFVSLGNPAESSSELMPLFRKINDLPLTLFISAADANKCPKNVNHFVFIDDLCGSGSQAIRYSKEMIPEIKKTHPNTEFSYLMLIGTKSGKAKILEESDFHNVDSVLELDTTYKCFDEESRTFKNKDHIIDKPKIEGFCGFYGKKLMEHFLLEKNPKIKEDALNNLADRKKFGFGNGQLSIGFHHNTPNNTLPIFWYNEDSTLWTPIFKRYNKRYK